MLGTSKLLAILGSASSGKATTIGNLVYKCGGIDMPTLEELEKGSNDNYAKAYHEIKAKNGELYFYTPENKVTTTENLDDANGLLLIVTPRHIDLQLQEIVGRLDSVATQFSHKKILVLVNKLDELNWSKTAFLDSVRATKTVFQGLGVSEERILCVPASALHSDNLIELSSNLKWYSTTTDGDELGIEKAVTVVAALDRILT